MKRFALPTVVFLVLTAIVSQAGTPLSSALIETAPDYTTQDGIAACDRSGPSGISTQFPCFVRDTNTEDSHTMQLGECTADITNFCYLATVDNQPAPSGLKFVVNVGAYKTHTPSERDAGYEAYINAFYLEEGGILSSDYFGSSDRPSDQQSPGTGKIDLSKVVTADTVIKLVVKYKTVGVPQYSVVVADDGNMTFDLEGQDLTLTVEGKPARVAVEAASEHVPGPEDGADPAADWSGKCGIPSMRFVVCNVDKAASDGLSFYARSKSFTFGPGSESPAPIWVSTNATYFHFPSIEFSGQSGMISVKTAAPHFLSDGTTLHTGNFSSFLPNGVLSQWGIEKTEVALKAALAASVTRGMTEEEVTAEFLITDDGVKVKFPTISYSCPVVTVKEKAAIAASSSVPTCAAKASVPPVETPTSTETPAIVVVKKTLKRGKSMKLSSLIKPIGSGKQKWSTTGGCKIKGKRLVAPKRKTSCKVTLKQAKSGKRKASTRKIVVKII